MGLIVRRNYSDNRNIPKRIIHPIAKPVAEPDIEITIERPKESELVNLPIPELDQLEIDETSASYMKKKRATKVKI